MSDGKVQCPYNESHRILVHRLAKHLEQCRPNYPNAGIDVCPFKGTHHIKKNLMEEHIKNCEFRSSAERILAPVGPPPAGPAVDSLIVRNLPNVEEDWDTEVPQARSYVSAMQEVLDHKNVLRQGKLNTGKAARRDFRQSEKQRLQNLSGNGARQ